MKDLLKIYLPKDDSQKKEIWGNALIVFDTNVLLNLYKYSGVTREVFFSIMETAKDRLWLPHQVALEFLLNRKEKIKAQEIDFNNHIKAIQNAHDGAIEKIEKGLNGIKKPFRKMDVDKIKEEIQNFFKGLEDRVISENKDKPDFKEDDVVLSELLKYYSDKIGEEYTNDELVKIYNDGKERYEREQPPGYKDYKTKEGKLKHYRDTQIKSEYGDLILWFQTIKKAKETSCNVIFVTDDSKEDWWKNTSGVNTPRPELLNEFMTETQKEILIYNSEQFLKNAHLITEQDPNINAIEEIIEYRKMSDIQRPNHINENEILIDDNIILDRDSLEYFETKHSLIETEEKLKNISAESDYLKYRIHNLEAELHKYEWNSDLPDEENERIVNRMGYDLSITQHDLERITYEYAVLREEQKELLVKLNYLENLVSRSSGRQMADKKQSKYK